jgi:soluble lytic murein transglycosylase-like protein
MKVLWMLLIVADGPQADSAARQRAAIEAQWVSIAKQRNSVRRQIQMAPATENSFFVTYDPAPAALCDPLPLFRRRALTESASQRAGISDELLDAVIEQESGFRPCSISPKGAMGLMQLMPSTAEEFGVNDAFDPDENVGAGAALLKQLMQRYGGDLNRVLGAYNAGASRVDQAGGVPAIPETMKYVEGILGRLEKKE